MTRREPQAYNYEYQGAGCFKVFKRWVEDGKQRVVEHLVRFNPKGMWHCDCDGFKFSKDKINSPCKHIKDIIAQMQNKHPFIIRNKDIFDWAIHYCKKGDTLGRR